MSVGEKSSEWVEQVLARFVSGSLVGQELVDALGAVRAYEVEVATQAAAMDYLVKGMRRSVRGYEGVASSEWSRLRASVVADGFARQFFVMEAYPLLASHRIPTSDVEFLLSVLDGCRASTSVRRAHIAGVVRALSAGVGEGGVE